ncbi:ATP-binding protein [Nocardiopsis lambiniae]|uniref:ATP-binding protein n=1 Tax=Nocardiopsis lambiniae TaxID=3075539 RepID=A0ABU2MEA7_9ACTN|nr:ATP-binding protein [Nocardiopsis sp. DSM 44743]MDT0331020.1 ATP-binding protein [Nocardiopsis sp. DSM 44743]
MGLRALAADRLGDCQVVDDAVLLKIELATNEVQHTPSSLRWPEFGVLIEHEQGHSVRVTVHGGSYFDASYVAQPESDAEHGCTLFLLDALTISWGNCATFSGRKIWFINISPGNILDPGLD